MKGLLIFLAVIGAALFGVHSFVESDWNKANQAKHAAEVESNRKPRIVSRSDDGCDVYAFQPGHGEQWRYFTRCKGGGATSTDNTYTQTTGAGKNARTETIPNSISTETRP